MMRFEDLLKLICRYAIQSKLQGSHASWLALLTDVREGDFEVNDEMESQIRLV
ncbi:MAG: hypothetical protein HQL06_16385 [Nitrospirae bacterium]|nr:hypothetical protein [Nitrospirota bacterium]